MNITQDGLFDLSAEPADTALSFEPTAAPLNDAAASSRAAKAEIGVGPLVNQNKDQIQQSLSTGGEDGLRATASNILDQNIQQDKLQKMSTGYLPKEVSSFLTKPTDAKSVIERTYANSVIKKSTEDAASRIEDNVLTTAQAEDPEAVDKFMTQHSDVLSLREYAISKAQNLQSTVDQDAFFHIPFPESFGGPIAVGSKNSPFHTILNWATLGVYGQAREEVNMRGNTPDTPALWNRNGLFGKTDFSTLLEANNIREQSKEILSQPTFEAGQTLFDKAFDRIKLQDPSTAQAWAMAIAGQTTNEMITRNAMTPISLIGAGAIAKTFKEIATGFGKGQVAARQPRPTPPSSGELTQGPDGVYRRGGNAAAVEDENIQEAKNAVEDVLRNSPASPTKANIAEATGDTAEAAVQKTMNSVVQNNPERDAIDTLMDMHRVNQEEIRRNPGNNSREEHTRMLNAGETYLEGQVDALKATTNIVRLPALAETGFRDVADLARQYFKGLENTVVNIDMYHDDITNTEHHVFTFSDYDGRPFSNKQQALNASERRGLGKAVVLGSDPNIVYLPKAAVFEKSFTDEFKTSKGSSYTLHEDGTTTRNKALRPEHPGDEGLKPRSLATGYITEGEYQAYKKAAASGKNASHIDNDGNVLLFTDVNNFVHIKAGKEPAIGKVPVEMLPDKKVHFGNQITEFGAGKQEIKPRSNFVHEKDKDGKWSFWLDDPQGTRSEVVPSVTPEPTHLPFDLSTGKFGQPLAEGPHIVRNGLGYHIKYMMPLNEQDPVIRDNHLITGPRTQSTSSSEKFHIINQSFLSYFRPAQDTLSHAEIENRGKVIYTENRLFRLIDGEMQHVQKLYNGLTGGNVTGVNSRYWNDFKRALTISQKMEDPKSGLPGYYMRTPLEIQNNWVNWFGYLPTEAQQQAYLAVGRMDYADWVFRNVGVYVNESRLGIMSHVIKTLPEGSNSGEMVRSQPVKGRFLTKIPAGDVGTLIIEKDGSYKWFNSQNPRDRVHYRQAFNRGEYRGIQLHNPDTYPIKISDKAGNPVRVVYVMSPNIESSALGLDQVGYRGGGHWDYNYDHYIKQPIMRKYTLRGVTHWIYEGDATFAPIKSHADGQVFTTNMNKIIRLLRDKKLAEAKTLHLSYSEQPWKDFVKAFFPSKDPITKELRPARFNLHEDFRVLPKGYTTADWDKGFINKYKSLPNAKLINAANGEQNLARNYQVEFTGARDSHDLFEPYNTGTIQNPMYKFQPAELVDPLVAQTRALKRIITSVAGDSYKYSAVEHWLQENMDMLDVHSKQEARHSPFATFMNNDLTRRWRNSGQGTAALSNRYKIQKLIGMPTYMDSQIHMIKQRMADEIYQSDSKLKKAVLIPPTWVLGKLSKPVDFFRGMAFHENLGLFNWMQLASQNAAYVNFIGMSPDHTLPGIFGSWMHIWSRVNKNGKIVSAMGKAAETFGWKPGQFEEAMRLYDSTGFDQIGRTLAVHDPDVKMLMSNADKVIKVGSKYFFELAEQNVRHGSWYTAVHEYRAAYPFKKINDLEVGKILRRANDLYANMGRDSKTLLNTGVLSMTLQFFKYMENVSHLFMSKRVGDRFQPALSQTKVAKLGRDKLNEMVATGKLTKDDDGTYRPGNTRTERMRTRAQMIAMYSFMFGPLGATGLALVPANDYVRKQALGGNLPFQSGPYIPGQDKLSTLLMEGPASMAGAYASGWWRTGNWDMSKGTFYNFNNRYGANGYQLMRDLLENNKSFWDIVLGASGSTIGNNLRSLSPFIEAWVSAYNDEQNNPFRLTAQDWLDGLKNVNSMRAADRLRYAIQYGKWVDRHGREQQPIGTTDAIFRTLFGTNDVNLDDLYLLHQVEQDRTEVYKQAAQEFIHYKNLQDQAIRNKDDSNAIVYGKNAIHAIDSRGVPPDEFSKIMKQYTSQRDTQSQTYDNFYKRLVPTDKKTGMDQGYQERYKQAH